MNTWRKARYTAINAGHYQNADDIASEYVIAKIKGNKTNLSQVIVDYLRANRGNMRSLKGRAKACAENIHIDDYRLVDESSGVCQINASLLKGLATEQRMIIKLIFEWGFTQFEIGELIGASESAVSQRIRIIRKIIRENVYEQQAGEKSQG